MSPEFEDRRSAGELGRTVDRLSDAVDKLDGTIDKLRDDTVTRREFDELKNGLMWMRRSLIAGPGFAALVYFMYRIFNANGVGT